MGVVEEELGRESRDSSRIPAEKVSKEIGSEALGNRAKSFFFSFLLTFFPFLPSFFSFLPFFFVNG